MGRTVFLGGRVFDGTGAALADADVLIEGGRIVDVGPGLDGDEAIDCSGKAILPGMFDTHVHLVSRYEDFDEVRVLRAVQRALLSRRGEHASHPRVRDHDGARRCRSGCRHAARRGGGLARRPEDADQRHDALDDRWAQRPLAPERRHRPMGTAVPGMPSGVCDGVDGVAAEGTGGDPCRSGRDQDRVVQASSLPPTIRRSRTSRRPRSRRSSSPPPISGGG